eukprot:6196047-Pleurochrysis_carterae.AAC.7
MKESSTSAAEKAAEDYESNMKQQRAAANVKYTNLLKKMQMERDAASEQLNALQGDITQMQRMLNQANAACAANKENAAAFSELIEAELQRANEGRIWARVREEQAKRAQAEQEASSNL